MEADGDLILRLRSGDERAFVSLVERYQEQMLRLAVSFVPSRAVAEEVVQDTWLAMLRGLQRFRGPLVAENLAVHHPGQPGPDDRYARAAHHPGPGSRAGRRSGAVRRLRGLV